MAKQKPYKVSKAEETRAWISEDDIMTICRAIERFSGPADVIESAIGALIFGRIVGFDGLRVVHSWRTLRKYEDLLGVSFKELLPARTDDSARLNGIRLADNFKAFWKALAAGVSSEPDARIVSA